MEGYIFDEQAIELGVLRRCRCQVSDLNEAQESALGLIIFHYADEAGLPLLDLADVRAVVTHLIS